jgi:hypothetical protein
LCQEERAAGAPGPPAGIIHFQSLYFVKNRRYPVFYGAIRS